MYKGAADLLTGRSMLTRGDRLLHARERIARLTRAQLSERIEVSVESIRKMELGEAPVRLIHTWGLAANLGVRQPWLAHGTGQAVRPARIASMLQNALPGLVGGQDAQLAPLVDTFVASLVALEAEQPEED